MPVLPLRDGHAIPTPGFGTGTAWFKDEPTGPFDRQLVDILKTAIEQGFRHIDGADCYGTEEEIGAAIKEAGVPREALFITTKVLDGLEDVPAAFESSLKKLGVDFVDLYLIHNPYVTKDRTVLQRAWRELEKIKDSGRAKSIGVANFQREHLETILEVARITPAVNQLEFHPYLQRAGYVRWMREHEIAVESFNGLTPVTKARPGPLDEPLARMARKYGVAESTILMRWQMQRNIIPVTTTKKAERLNEYLAACEMQLSKEDEEEITRVGLGHHFRAWNPDLFDPEDRS